MMKLMTIALLAFLTACATQLSETDKANSRIQYDLGVEHLSKGNITGALQAFSSAENLDPSFPELHNALGLVYYALGRYQDARKHFDLALLLRPKWSEVHNNLGILSSTLGRYDEAIAHFDIALKDVLYDSPSHAEGNKGYALYKQGDTAQALKHIKNATLVNPKFCRGFLWLGEIYQGQKDVRMAERYLDRFFEKCVMDPNLRNSIDAQSTAEAYLRLGQVTLAAGNVERAKTAFQSCMSMGKDTSHYDKCDEGFRQIPQ